MSARGEEDRVMPVVAKNWPFVLLRADRLLDGEGRPPVTGAAVLFENGKIAAVGCRAELRAPEGSKVHEVDYGDATIMPGLVDAHTHLVMPGDGTRGDDVAKEDDEVLLLQAARNARVVLHSGVTTVRENGAKNRIAFSLREGIRRGLVSGPRMVICGRPLTMTGGHMWYFGSEADGPERVRVAVRQLLKEGADYIKIAATGGSTRTSNKYRASYTVAELRAITDEAHRHGKLTATHCTSAQGVENSLDADVDMIIHCIFAEPDGTYRFRPDLVERLLTAHTWVNPTLYVSRALKDRLDAKRERGEVLTREQEADIEWAKVANDFRLEAVSRMIKAGVRMAAGSDSPWGWFGPGEFVREMEMLARAGLSNGDAIVSGTSGAADSMGIGDVAGRLLPGRWADVLVVAGDPTQDLGNLTHVLAVYQAGHRVDASTDR
jgi:imidazolonepropionase-like amidohydrolase